MVPILLLLALPLLYARPRPPRFAVEYQAAATGDRWLFDGMHPDSLTAAAAIAAFEAQGDRMGTHRITAKRIREVEPVRVWSIFSVGTAGAPPGPHVIAVYPTQDAARTALRAVTAKGVVRPEWGRMYVAPSWAPAGILPGR